MIANLHVPWIKHLPRKNIQFGYQSKTSQDERMNSNIQAFSGGTCHQTPPPPPALPCHGLNWLQSLLSPLLCLRTTY